MRFNPDIHHRRSIRLSEHNYSESCHYFITLCASQRQSLFGNIADNNMKLNDAGMMVETIWRQLPEYYAGVELNEYVVMPNHFHAIITVVEQGAASSAPTLGNILRRFKSVSAIAVNRCLNRQGQPVWQRNYYEHIIRSDQAYQNITEYIRTNPKLWQEDAYFVYPS